MPRVGCKLRRLSTAAATVRMLVDREGQAGHAYVKRSSGSPRFDRCALTHARRMAFKPGVDADGQALDVWINVRVEPSTIGVSARL
jgi:TonB family protein